jgi:hypothetical protein
VLFVESPENGIHGITRLGAAGGVMGHVLLVVAPLRGVFRKSPEGVLFANIWPGKHINILWVVPTMESCRAQDGFYETEYFIYIDEVGQMMMQGENSRAGEAHLTRYTEPERAKVYQSPPELRQRFRPQIMFDALSTMRNRQASWSWSTAVRAFLLSADMPTQYDNSREAMLDGIKKSWKTDPICTSVVIVFWQRYLCDLADEYNSTRGSHEPHAHPLDWIFQWMPVMADRALPGDLLNSLEQCGWLMVSGAPRVEKDEPDFQFPARGSAYTEHHARAEY